MSFPTRTGLILRMHYHTARYLAPRMGVGNRLLPLRRRGTKAVGQKLVEGGLYSSCNSLMYGRLPSSSLQNF